MAEETKNYPTHPALLGDKVFLRAAVPDDIIDAHYWLTQSDPDSIFPFISRPVSPSEAAETFRKQEKSEMDMTLMVIKKADEEPVGVISTMNFNALNRSTEINVLIDPEKRRKGLGRDALKIFSKYLFMQRGLNRIYAQVAGFNTPGAKLFNSVGFKIDGKLRQNHFYKGEFHDTIVYSLLRFELDW